MRSAERIDSAPAAWLLTQGELPLRLFRRQIGGKSDGQDAVALPQTR
jgi:hypothetical protein